MARADRQSDERILSLLAARAKGHTAREVGAMAGLHKTYVRAIVSRIMAADLAESGEPEHVVRRAYGVERGLA